MDKCNSAVKNKILGNIHTKNNKLLVLRLFTDFLRIINIGFDGFTGFNKKMGY